MPSRRECLFRGGVLAGAAAGLLPRGGAAAPRCIAAPRFGGELCKTYVDVNKAYQETYHASRDPAALWIACVAVVFATYGHVIQQPRIAAEAYGAFDRVALGDGLRVVQPLTRAWRDDDGAAFRSSFEPVFDGTAPHPSFDPGRLIAALGSGDPLILMGGKHPVVLTALAYAGSGRRLVAGFVFDPTPLVGPRALDLDEVMPRAAGGDLVYAVRTRLTKA